MSTKYRTIEDVDEKLKSIPMFGDQGRLAANFSLEAIRAFCSGMGNPQDQFKSIHVAGTNGKGTTCRMLASVLQSAGYKTGLFTSPHLIDYRERVNVNAEWIPEDELLQFFQHHDELIETVQLSYFELSTALAFWYFNKEKVDIAVIETGLGGRLDATNILKPIATAITSIGLDHTDILGDSVELIAREKAGIIKDGTPVVTGIIPENAMYEIRKRASELDAPVIETAAMELKYGKEKPDKFVHSRDSIAARRNQKIVTAVLNCVSDQIPVSSGIQANGFEKWPVRYPTGVSFRKVHPRYSWYFDGAHNIDAIRLLKEQLAELAPLNRWTMVFSMMQDKLSSEMVEEISELGSVFYHPLKMIRVATENQITGQMPQVKLLHGAEYLPESWVQKNKSELVIFGGSFYFYQTVKRWMDNIADQ